MNNDKSLIVDNRETALVEQSLLDDMASRLQKFAPGSQKLAPPEAMALAQIALAHGLDPFNGECWFIPGSGVMAGIKGHRRAAHKQMERTGGGNYWPEFTMLSPEEKQAMGIPVRALAYECKLRDTQTIRAYTEQIKELLSVGVPWNSVQEIVGDRPFTSGIGYAMPSKPDPNCPKCKNSGGWLKSRKGKSYPCGCWESSKMTTVQLAQKRAEAEALKRRFDLPFREGIEQDNDTIAKNARIASSDPEDVQSRRESGSAKLYDNGVIEGSFEEQGNDESALVAPINIKIARKRKTPGGITYESLDYERLEVVKASSDKESSACATEVMSAFNELTGELLDFGAEIPHDASLLKLEEIAKEIDFVMPLRQAFEDGVQ